MSSRSLLFGTALLVTTLFSARAADRPFIRTGEAPIPSETPAASDPSVDGRDGFRSWPAVIGENFSSPMFYDLDGDGVMEVITTDRQSTYVFDASGNLLPGWPRTGGSDNIPAVADIDEDGTPEIFVASPGAPGKIRCFHRDGSIQPGFPVNLPYQYWLNVTAPAVADVDGDGHLDVGAQTEPGVAFFDRFGQPLPGWPYRWTTSQNIPWSAPAVADLDRDGHMEVVVGNNNMYDWGVHVIRHDGTAMPGWPKPTNNIFSSAAVGDLDGDGDLEIVIQEGDPTWYGNRMHVWHHDGTYLPGWPKEIAPEWESSRSNPAIADVNDDGQVEIVTQTGDGMLHIFQPTGPELDGYPRLIPGGGSISSVQVIDVDGDRIEEFFLCYYQGTSQWVSGWKLDGSVLPGFPKLLYAGSELGAHSSAHFADLEGDGDLDLCAQGGTFGTGRVRVYEVDGSVFHPGTTRADWPKIRHDTRNTGYFEPPDPAGTADLRVSGGRLVCSPNPLILGGTASWRLAAPVSVAGTGHITLFDLGGRRVGSARLNGGTPATIAVREMFESPPAPGVYYARLTGAGRADTKTRVVIVGR